MPFAGDAAGARAAAEALRSLETRPGDELILVDNAGMAVHQDGVSVIRAPGERSPAHARNVGAAHAANQWILFLDADTRAPATLLDTYFKHEIADDVGAVAGEVVPAAGADSLAARYGAARSFLGQQAHLEHPYRPRAAAANLLVRRAAFAAIGGFYEGVRAGEDTDFTWRLQAAGWRLELRSQAWVEHRYRTTVSDLRRQWRGYAAGRAWLARRYDGFQPQPALARALRRGRTRQSPSPGARRRPPRGVPGAQAGHLERGRYLALDVLLSLDELAGLTLSNRPAAEDRRHRPAVEVVMVADRFPARGDPLVELAATIENVRVEATARPEAFDVEAAHRLAVDYLEDDGVAMRALATAMLALRHPLRSAIELAGGRSGERRLSELAPAVRRLERDEGARVLALGGDQAWATATRIARLAGRPIGELPRQSRRGGARWLHARRR
jgi:hypothetical protein